MSCRKSIEPQYIRTILRKIHAERRLPLCAEASRLEMKLQLCVVVLSVVAALTVANGPMLALEPSGRTHHSFTDPDAGVKLTAQAAAQRDGFFVVPTSCTHKAPTVSVSPGVAPSVLAGTSVNYTVSVLNNNAPVCQATSFALALSAANSWLARLSKQAVTALPGASESAVLNVISPAGAIPGTYRLSISAWDPSDPRYVSTVSAKYVVGVAVSTALTARASTDRSSYTRNQTVVMTAKVLTGASAATGATVTFKTTKPDGTSRLGSAVTDGNGVATYQYRLSGEAPAGVYKVSVAAGWNSASAAGTTSFTAK